MSLWSRGLPALAMGRWFHAAGKRLVRERVYMRGRWTPMVLVRRRYSETARLRAAVWELSEALRLTHEYVGVQTLPPVAGWSWYDALARHRPEYVEYVQRSVAARQETP